MTHKWKSCADKEYIMQINWVAQQSVKKHNLFSQLFEHIFKVLTAYKDWKECAYTSAIRMESSLNCGVGCST